MPRPHCVSTQQRPQMSLIFYQPISRSPNKGWSAAGREQDWCLPGHTGAVSGPGATLTRRMVCRGATRHRTCSCGTWTADIDRRLLTLPRKNESKRFIVKMKRWGGWRQPASAGHAVQMLQKLQSRCCIFKQSLVYQARTFTLDRAAEPKISAGICSYMQAQLKESSLNPPHPKNLYNRNRAVKGI